MIKSYKSKRFVAKELWQSYECWTTRLSAIHVHVVAQIYVLQLRGGLVWTHVFLYKC